MEEIRYRSLRLIERAKIYPSTDESILDGRTIRRLEKWKNQPPFDKNPTWFEQRLTGDGLNEKRLATLMSASAPSCENIHSDGSGDWLNRTLEIYSRCRGSSLPNTVRERVEKATLSAGFLNLIAPVLINFQAQLTRILSGVSQKIGVQFISPALQDDLILNLAQRLILCLNRTLTLEINIARLQGKLHGETPTQRFESFCEYLSTEEAFKSLLQEYPVLFRQILIITEARLSFLEQFFEHLTLDWQSLWTTFFPGNTESVLTQLSLDGDFHRGGRSVIVISFASGQKLVYKPRSLQVDIHFYKLLEWLNQKGIKNSLRPIRTLAYKTHGWVEFVENNECNSVDDVQRFFYRQGGYLALLHMLCATDFHYENLIASGEQPVLIDLESLFHPVIKKLDMENAAQLAQKVLLDSVLRVGMLPQKTWIKDPAQNMDVSAMGVTSKQLSASALPTLENTGTDEIRLVRKRLEFGSEVERAKPRLNGNYINSLDYREYIIDGFSDVYNILSDYRDELLFPNGLLAIFADDEVRVVPRNTMTYQTLLLESYHPDALRDAIDRDRLFDRLWTSFADYEKSSEIILHAEQDELWKGDVPYFSTQARSRDLVCGEGSVIKDYFRSTGLERTNQRLNSFCEEDLRRQIGIIDASLATLVSFETISHSNQYRTELSNCWKRSPLKKPQRKISSIKTDLIAEAKRIGDHLVETAILGFDDASWVNNAIAGEYISLTPAGLDLYSGLPGITLFLAYLGITVKDSKYTDLAKKAIVTIQKQIDTKIEQLLEIGAFNGIGSLLYSFTHLALLWQNTNLLASAQKIVKALTPLVEQDDQPHDVIAGYAGLISASLSFYSASGDQSSLNLAIRCGEKLMASARPQAVGLGWNITISGKNLALTGFSHGAAGSSWALLKLAKVTQKIEFRDTAMQGIKYERSLFSSAAGNWPDLRENTEGEKERLDNGPNFMVAWCHGAPGIGLARLDTLELGDDQFEQEVRDAIKITRKDVFDNFNHSLCHGDLGNLDFILFASQKLQDASLKRTSYAIADEILGDIKLNGWRTGFPMNIETFGLMPGISGIGYELLRLANPNKVPDILLLKMPYSKSALTHES